jgi:hypothetical protein
MYKKLLKNERGDMSFFTIFVILAINMLMAFVLLFASVQINCMNIRNAAKMELNNVSARIYADTFHSQREANLDSYNVVTCDATFRIHMFGELFPPITQHITLTGSHNTKY